MDEFTHGGTPPTLWQRLHTHHHDDCGCKSYGYKKRIERLARQIEKLSWMIELMDQEPGITSEGAEYHWQYAHASLS